MIELVGAIGWGLLACGAITHLWHHRRLRELIAMHLDNDRLAAAAITGAEVVLAGTIPVLVIVESSLLRLVAAAATALALAFVAWIARLLSIGSDLPCACSFSAAPTTKWSLLRAVCVALVAVFIFYAGPNSTADTADHLATLAVGWAIATGVFVFPEAVAWPDHSRALMARVEAHTTTSSPVTGTQS